MLPVIKRQVYDHCTIIKGVTINKNVTAGVFCLSTVFFSFTAYINLCTYIIQSEDIFGRTVFLCNDNGRMFFFSTVTLPVFGS